MDRWTDTACHRDAKKAGDRSKVKEPKNVNSKDRKRKKNNNKRKDDKAEEFIEM